MQQSPPSPRPPGDVPGRGRAEAVDADIRDLLERVGKVEPHLLWAKWIAGVIVLLAAALIYRASEMTVTIGGGGDGPPLP